MFCCLHDPGLAFFLSETPRQEEAGAGPLEWTAFALTLILAVLAFGVPA